MSGVCEDVWLTQSWLFTCPCVYLCVSACPEVGSGQTGVGKREREAEGRHCHTLQGRLTSGPSFFLYIPTRRPPPHPLLWLQMTALNLLPPKPHMSQLLAVSAEAGGPLFPQELPVSAHPAFTHLHTHHTHMHWHQHLWNHLATTFSSLSLSCGPAAHRRLWERG